MSYLNTGKLDTCIYIKINPNMSLEFKKYFFVINSSASTD